MSKVMTFSRVFPSYHPKAGQPTYFMEKIHKSIDRGLLDGNKHFVPHAVNQMFNFAVYSEVIPKHHTIRAGHHWKVGDWFRPVVWGNDVNPKSGRSGPYHSKQITFAPDIQVKKVWRIDIDEDGSVLINGELYAYANSDFALEPLAANDGLSVPDLFCWFKNGPIKDHQIICWNESIEY